MTYAAHDIGIDIGGTFTDAVLSDGVHTVGSIKSLTTPHDPTLGAIEGVRSLLGEYSVSPQSIRRVVHATTLATNLVLEQAGAFIAVVATEGFADLIRLGRTKRAGDARYDLLWETDAAPFQHDMVFEVPERIDSRGQVLRRLRTEDAAATASAIRARSPEAVAVCLLNSYANPQHEQHLGRILKAQMPGAHIALSSDIWPELREYDRSMTTIMSAYVAPSVVGYLEKLEIELAALGVDAPLQFMQSSGGITSVKNSIRRAIYTVESGPAAGVVAASDAGRLIGEPNVISFDMGGTTAKTGLTHGGDPVVTNEFRLGSGVSSKGHGGFPIRIPVIDIAEVGVGGGSIAWVDEGGVLKVGPQSAGADPGPACYGRGGVLPTVTDATLVLGYLSASYFAGGDMPLSVDAAHHAIEDRVAKPLGIAVPEAAYGIYRVVNSSMAGAVRVVTVERGVDPRIYSIVAFGGAGPVHIVPVMEDLGASRVVIPARAGVMSAAGLLSSSVTADRMRTQIMDLQAANATEAGGVLESLEREAIQELLDQGVARADIGVDYSLDVRWRGQGHEVRVPCAVRDFSDDVRDEIAARFSDGYFERFGFRRRDPVELVSFHVRAGAVVERVLVTGEAASDGEGDACLGKRAAYFPESGGYIDTAVYDRDRLQPGCAVYGPAIAHGADSTIVLPPGYQAAVDDKGNVLIIRPGPPEAIDAKGRLIGRRALS